MFSSNIVKNIKVNFFQKHRQKITSLRHCIVKKTPARLALWKWSLNNIWTICISGTVSLCLACCVPGWGRWAALQLGSASRPGAGVVRRMGNYRDWPRNRAQWESGWTEHQNFQGEPEIVVVLPSLNSKIFGRLKSQFWAPKYWQFGPKSSKVPIFRCPKVELRSLKSKNGGDHFFTPTSPQNGGIYIYFVRY